MLETDKQKGSEIFFEKTFKKFWWFKKMIYLCTTFRSEKRADGMKREMFFIAI